MAIGMTMDAFTPQTPHLEYSGEVFDNSKRHDRNWNFQLINQ